jgi:hypothetical protein
MIENAAPTTATTDGAPGSMAFDAAVVSRITAGGNLGLDRFANSSVLEEGLINLVALDAIVERLGARWEGRREAIYDMAERVLERIIGPNGFFVRVSETDFLVAQPDRSRYAAQASCLRALGEILQHFLGAASHHDLRISEVHSMEDGEIRAAALDPAQTLERHDHESRTAEAVAVSTKEVIDSALLSLERWSPFVAASGRSVRVSCRLEPVFELKNNGRIGYRLHSQVIDVVTEERLPAAEVSLLSRADLLRIDMATIARGLARIASSADPGRELSLIIPVSYITLSHRNGRALLSQAFAQARAAVARGVICEVASIEDVPQGALLSAISLIKPWVLFIIGYLAGPHVRISAGMKEAGVQALAFTCPPDISGDAAFLSWLTKSIRAAKGATRTVMVYGCSPRQMVLAAAAGATHASLGGVRPTQ